MVNDSDIVANLKTQFKPSDFDALSDFCFEDFSALSYLLFRHGTILKLRLAKAVQGFIYRTLLSFLTLGTYMIRSGFSGQVPYRQFYFTCFIVVLSPLQILIYATFFRDYAYNCRYRIFGLYRYNFMFKVVDPGAVTVDIISAILDWLILILPFEITAFTDKVVTQDGLNLSSAAYNGY
mmetsp:Transcript_1508/g.2005  ORF Transcript_1508/g.2005 Transcript_1508/m.2005 type:complete len:179 (-) Transcript_1508:3498-4034(-)